MVHALVAGWCDRLEVLEVFLVLVVRQRLQRFFVESVKVAGVAGSL